MQSNEMVRCPRCTRPNLPGAARCAGCGELLPGPEPPQAGPPVGDASAEDNPELLYQHASSLMDLADMQSAAPLFRRILASDPDNVAALDQLEAIYRSSEQWSELTELLEQVAGESQDVSRRCELLDRAATLHDGVLAQPDRAATLRSRIRALRGGQP